MPDKNNIPDYNLFAKYFAKETNIQETNKLESWVQLSSANRKTFDQMYFLWMQSVKTKTKHQIDSSAAWNKLQSRMHKQEKKLLIVKDEPSIYLRTAKNLLKLAAVLFIGWLIGYFVNTPKVSDVYLSQQTNLDTASVLLADQTSVKLNKNSELTYPEKFSKDKRVVKLKGEAFFKVKPNKKKPFIIEAGKAQIKVLGTSFNVKAYDTVNKISVTVKTGMVELRNTEVKAQKIVLIKGETGIIDYDNSKMFKVQNKLQNEAELYWLSKKLVFKHTELSIVVQTLSNIFNVDIKLANDSLNNCLLTVPFNNMNLDEILQVIAVTFDLKIERDGSQITLYGNGCN